MADWLFNWLDARARAIEQHKRLRQTKRHRNQNHQKKKKHMAFSSSSSFDFSSSSSSASSFPPSSVDEAAQTKKMYLSVDELLMAMNDPGELSKIMARSRAVASKEKEEYESDTKKMLMRMVKNTIDKQSRTLASSFAILAKIKEVKVPVELHTIRIGTPLVYAQTRPNVHWAHSLPIGKEDWSKVEITWDRATAEKNEATEEKARTTSSEYDVKTMLDCVDKYSRQLVYAMQKAAKMKATHQMEATRCVVVFSWSVPETDFLLKKSAQ